MKLNESLAISTDKVLLVPYDRRHVLTYHGWMEDPAIQEATASERLTLEEEYENQQSWRASRDKMTFIVCHPLSSSSSTSSSSSSSSPTVQAGVADAPDRMVGDINLFLSPYDDDYDDDDDEDQQSSSGSHTNRYVGEVDIMIAHVRDQGRGMGRAAVVAFLEYVGRNVEGILGEYCGQDGGGGEDERRRRERKLARLMAKINEGNAKSIGLFKNLGFEQEGEVNFFGEIKLVLKFDQGKGVVGCPPEGYQELRYVRPEGEE